MDLPETSTVRSALASCQRRMWFLERLNDGRSLLNCHVMLSLRGALDITALGLAFEAVIERHEVLRTVYTEVDGDPVARLLPPGRFSLTVTSIEATDPHDIEQEIARHSRSDALRPFDLENGPILWSRLLRVTPRLHVLSLNVHHIAFDATSTNLLLRELDALYRHFRSPAAGGRPPLPAPGLQFSEFVRIERSTDAMRRAAWLAFWKERLAVEAPRLELPTGRSPAGRPTRLAGQVPLRIGAATRARLVQAAADLDASLHITLFAALAVTLHRFSGQTLVQVGTPVANRRTPGAESAIGCMFNTVVLRCELAGNPRFRELVGQLRGSSREVYRNAALPFERVVEGLAPDRHGLHNPLFEVLYSLRSTAEEHAEIGDVEVERLRIPLPTTTVDLHAAFLDDPSQLTCSLIYDEGLYEEDAIRRLARGLGCVLEAVAADPGARIADLPIMTDDDRAGVVTECNRTEVAYPADLGVHRLFERLATSRPTATAFVHPDGETSYRELNAAANRLAHFLVQRGVRPGARVGIAFERGFDGVVATLAVLKAGAVYVPVDPAHPLPRLHGLLQDCGAAAVIAPAILSDGFGAAFRTVCPEADRSEIASQPHTDPGIDRRGEELAYIMYTSGSTGKPKGVAVPHRAICRLVSNPGYIELRGDERVALASNPAFDAATFEIYAALLGGGAIVPIDRNALLSPGDLASALAQRRVTTLFLTTSLFHTIARQRPDAFAGLRDLLVGGEALDGAAARRVLTARPPQRLLNVYGPTEGTTFSTWHEVAPGLLDGASVPIGRPLANTRILLLDAYRQPVPIGVAGELFIGGAGLARGYWGQEALTRERFVEDPFTPGATLYRSGDRGRRLANGEIDFLGRQDQQVKIRGFRVEPAEVEAIVRGQPAVADAAVTAVEGADGTRQLIAFCVLDADFVLESALEQPAAALRAGLSGVLPDYMMPARFVLLERLPLTPSGKVDRRALVAPAEPPAPAAERLADNDVLRRLVGIWERVLGGSGFDLEDDFFKVGGHSLLAARVLAEVRREFGKTLALVDLFENPTIAGLADRLRADARASPRLITLRSTGWRRPLFFIHGKLDVLVDHLDEDRPLYQLHPGSSWIWDEQSVEELAAAHLLDIRRLQPDGPYALAGFSFGGMIAYEMARQLQSAGESVGRLVLVDPTPPRRGADPSSKPGGGHLRGVPGRRRQVRHATRFLARNLRKQFESASNRIAILAYKVGRRPLPRHLLRFEMVSAFQRLARRYTYRPIDVPLVLLEPGGRESRSALWAPLARGGLERQILGAPSHTSVFDEPYVGRLAEALARHLDRQIG